MKRILALMLLAGVTASCSKPMPDTRDADAEAIRAVLLHVDDAVAAHDFDAAMKVYASDAVMLAPGAPPLVGTDAIRAAFQAAFGAPNSSITLTPTKIEVARSGDLAYAYGTGKTVMGDPSTGTTKEESNKWVTVFRKQPDGSWQLVADIFNGGPPPAPAQ